MATAVRSSEEIMEKVGGLEGHLNCAGHQVYYQIRGEGIPLVFLHDGLLHSTGFNAVMEHLKDDYLLVTYDRPQYGQSPPPSSPVSHTSILDDLLCQMGIAQCVLIGGSAGGSYAIDYTLAYPHKVEGLLLVGAALSGYDFSEHMVTRGGREVPGDSLEAWIHFWCEDPWLMAEENKEAKQTFAEIIRNSPQNLEPYEVDFLDEIRAIDRLSEIDIPCLIVIGEVDIADNHAVAGILQHDILKSKRIIVPHTGHLVYLEQPVYFSNLVRDFLKKLSRNGSA